MSENARLLGAIDDLRGHSDGAIQSLIDRFVDGVRDAGETGVTQPLGGGLGPDERVWPVSLSTSDDSTAEGKDHTDLEVIASADTLQRMIDGSYSPVDAFRDGKLRVAGRISPRVTRRLFAR